MTCIIWHRNKLLTDSASVNGVEWTENGRKLIPVNSNIFIQETPESIPDPIVGFTYTHATKPAIAFMDMLQAACLTTMNAGLEGKRWDSPVSILTTQYQLFAASALWNYDNYFKVLLIGRDKNYVFAPCRLGPGTDECTTEFVGFVPYEKSESIMLGATSIKLLFTMDMNPKIQTIRAMHQIMFESSAVGGRVYEYEVMRNPTRSRGVEIACTGMWEEPSKEVLAAAPSLLEYPYPPNLIYNKRAFAAKDRTLTKPGRTKPTDYQRYVRAHAAHFKLRQTKRK